MFYNDFYTLPKSFKEVLSKLNIGGSIAIATTVLNIYYEVSNRN